MQGVSVVLPNHNHAVELRTSLACIVGQTRPFDEIVVIDDASTDESLAVIEEFAALHPNLKLLRNEERLGVPKTVNRGLNAAACDYVVLASADERIDANMCEALMGAVATDPGLRLAVSQYSEWNPADGAVVTYDHASPLGMWYAQGEAPVFISPSELSVLLMKRFVWLSINTALFRRDALLEAGGLDPALRWHSDWFAIYSIALRHGFCAVSRSLACFRVSPHSYSAVGMRDRSAQAQVMVNMLNKLNAPEHADMLRAITEAPAALSPFVRDIIPVLARRPAWYPLLLPLARWWFGEVLKGRRPGLLARLVDRHRIRRHQRGKSSA